MDGLFPPFQSWMKSTKEENRLALNIHKSSQEVEKEKWELQRTMDYMLYFQRLVNKYKCGSIKTPKMATLTKDGTNWFVMLKQGCNSTMAIDSVVYSRYLISNSKLLIILKNSFYN